MSLYNLLNGMNAEVAVLVSPFLPMRADKFPRFRDVFLHADDSPVAGDIFVYTRMGGGNAECWDDCEYGNCPACQAENLRESENCVGSYEDEFDCTYKTFVFKVPEEHIKDFDFALSGKISLTSSWYKSRLTEMFSDSEKITQMLSGALK